ncbi:MAG: hypothetical protein JXD23_17150 [Spirochaetales bacterium]|nr:hypothetical protein [Spirochaetales bacterium]
MTKEEISSKLGSKSSYSKQEVVDLVYNVMSAYDAADIALQKRLIAENEARFEAWKQAYLAGMEKAEADARLAWTENTIVWIAESLIGGGLVVYGIYKADPAIIATGGLMAGCGAFRLAIAIK